MNWMHYKTDPGTAEKPDPVQKLTVLLKFMFDKFERVHLKISRSKQVSSEI